MPGITDGLLVGDVGGTHARLAWRAVRGEPLRDVTIWRTADASSLEDALVRYVEGLRGAMIRAAVLAVAADVEGATPEQMLPLTNGPWRFSQRSVRLALTARPAAAGLAHVHLINDFTALAWSLPGLPSSSLHQIGGGAAVPDAPRALLGPGTGLGVSGLLPTSGPHGFVAISGEGGHTTLPAVTEDEQRAVTWLQGRYGHASAERALSGAGLEDLYRALILQCSPLQAMDVANAQDFIRGLEAPPTAAQISERALSLGDTSCMKVLEVFTGLLGRVAGNLALTLGARGGVYLGGGILPRWWPWLEGSPLRPAFEDKGRFRGYLQRVPVYLIVEPHAALLGAAAAWDQTLNRSSPVGD